MGMLSHGRIGVRQAGHREPGETMLSSFGSRWITTLRKLPTMRPKAAAQTETVSTRSFPGQEALAVLRSWARLQPFRKFRGAAFRGRIVWLEGQESFHGVQRGVQPARRLVGEAQIEADSRIRRALPSR